MNATAVDEALNYICTALDCSIFPNQSDKSVSLGNVALIENDPDNLLGDTTIICSLVNIEEEAVLRNGRFITRSPNNNEEVIRHNPPEYLNLYLLFTSKDTTYRQDVTNILNVISFFQQNISISSDNIPRIGGDEPCQDLSEAEFPREIERLVFDLYTMSFEQLNHLWGVLGGKYYPSVLYKCRLVELISIPNNPSNAINSIERNEKVI